MHLNTLNWSASADVGIIAYFYVISWNIPEICTAWARRLLKSINNVQW